MIRNLTVGFVAYQIRKGILKEEDQALYEYAYVLLFIQFMNISGAILLGLFFGDILSVAAYLAVFIPLRHFAGGYHAKSPEMCSVSSFAVLLLFCIIEKSGFFFRFFIVSMLLLILSFIIIWSLSPVAAPDKPLDAQENDRYKKKARGFLFFDMLLVLFLFYFRIWSCGSMAAMALIGIAALQIIGELIER